ncbi:MAG: DUF488 domain-containing protein [Nitrospiraceae bacterium]|nr:DUF488 domain-containing protein [Nitrospiraceae bacterium]
MSPGEKVIYTIGHSTRSGGDLIRMLKKQGIQVVCDVRTLPGSTLNPQFNIDTFPGELEKEGIKYFHMKGLGGLRHPEKGSPNTGWLNPSFRGFADYMQTPEFDRNLEALVEIASREKAAIMCAEAVPWRCHRLLIADALAVRGWRVEHIVGVKGLQRHELTPFLKADGTRITYPGKEKPAPAAAREGEKTG